MCFLNWKVLLPRGRSLQAASRYGGDSDQDRAGADVCGERLLKWWKIGRKMMKDRNARIWGCVCQDGMKSPATYTSSEFLCRSSWRLCWMAWFGGINQSGWMWGESRWRFWLQVPRCWIQSCCFCGILDMTCFYKPEYIETRRRR